MRYAALVMVLVFGLYQNFWHLGSSNWAADEPTYGRYGSEYIHGVFNGNFEHPFTAKYLIGISQWLFGTHSVGIRLLAVLAGFGTAAVLWIWTRQEAGWWTATFVAGLWLLLPRESREMTIRIDRHGLLEPFLAFFVVLALYAGWRWARTGRWCWVFTCGTAVGLATTTKISGVLISAAIVAGILIMMKSWRSVGQLGVAAAAAIVTAVATYVPMGASVSQTWHVMWYPVHFQSEHSALGHQVLVNDATYQFAPWWANLWFNQQAYGEIAFTALIIGVIAALVIVRNALVFWILGGMAPFLIFYCFIANVSLPFYFHVWQPELIMLAGLGTSALAQLVIRRWQRWGASPILVGMAGLVVAISMTLVVASINTAAAVATARPTGVALLPQRLEAENVDGQLLVTGFYGLEPKPILDRWRPITAAPADLSAIDAIAVQHGREGHHAPSKEVLDLIADNQDRLRHIDVGDGVELWIAEQPLRPHKT